MEVLWRKIGTVFVTVHKYSDEGSQDLPGEGYQTRTELFPQEFSSGNVSLKLKGLQVVDAGTYHCFVRNPEWSQEATTELRVAAVAPVFIDVLGPQGHGIRLACRSTGWFPKPELQWVGKNWQNLVMEIVTNVTQDRDNLYSVVSHVTVTEGEDNGDISCIVRNGLLEPERQSAIHLSGDIFPRVSPWLAAFWVLFALVLIAAGACAYLGYAAKQKASQKKTSEQKALLNFVCQELRETLEAQKNAFESERGNLRRTTETEQDKNTQLESELKVQRQKNETEQDKNTQLESVRVTLELVCKHPEITVSEDGRRVQHNPQSPWPSGLCGALIALGNEGFVDKDHYALWVGLAGGAGRLDTTSQKGQRLRGNSPVTHRINDNMN
ncbi:Butyrophilin subfamily 3 member A3 [Chelonia mydas]|uniref:Butyrophilin subfamily 3 member A3 n=1 Tax=Chelonia mydas TaxID=8469 RepID=M7B2S5_CHEMY|nr:Butyrophilin subfamily 3 member A3 [Chelonia mydas]